MARNTRSLFALLPLLSLLLLFTGCDAAIDADPYSGDPIEQAQQWFEAEARAPSKTKSSLDIFYPDWSSGITIARPDGGTAVVTTLWRGAEVVYNEDLYFLRVLAVLLDESGEVEDGRILEFSSFEDIRIDSTEFAVSRWLAGEGFGSGTVLINELSVTNEPIEAHLVLPNGERIGADVRWVEVALGKLATQMCQEVGRSREYAAYITGRPRWAVDVYLVCHNVDHDGTQGDQPVNDDGGGYSDYGHNEPAWGKAVKLVNKIRKAVDKGEDLGDVATWRKMLGDEWDTIAGCAVGVATGSSAATELINCALDLLVGFKGDDLIGILRSAGKLDQVLNVAKGTPVFRYLAESVGSLDNLVDIAKHTPDGRSNFRIPGSSADAVFNSLESGTGINRLPISDRNGVQTGWRIPTSEGGINYYWRDTSHNLPAIQIFPSPDPNVENFKIRFDFR